MEVGELFRIGEEYGSSGGQTGLLTDVQSEPKANILSWPDTAPAKIAVLLVVKDKEAQIDDMLWELDNTLFAWPQESVKIWLVDEASSDHTAEKLEEWAATCVWTVEVLRNTESGGMTLAYLDSYRKIVADKKFQSEWVVRLETDDRQARTDLWTGLLKELPAREGCLVAQSQVEDCGDLRALEWSARLDRAGLGRFCPEVAGGIAWDKDKLAGLLEDPLLMDYPHDWGLDLLLMGIGTQKGHAGRIIDVESAIPNEFVPQGADRKQKQAWGWVDNFLSRREASGETGHLASI